jgi:hypothetical protein
MNSGKARVFMRSGILMIGLLLVSQLSAQNEKAPPSELAKDMLGAWILVGTPDKIGEPPAKGGRIKFFGRRHWAITQADPNTGQVVFHHGGTYTLDGDEYIEKFEFANESTKRLINQTNKFKVKVEGDTYTQIGLGNPYSEVWKRLK